MTKNINEGPASTPDFSRAYILPDSSGGYVAGSSDGFEGLTVVSSPEKALENLQIAKIVEGRRDGVNLTGIALGIVPPDDPRTAEELFDETARAFGFEPDELKRSAEQEVRDSDH